jgi:hypothetical protein
MRTIARELEPREADRLPRIYVRHALLYPYNMPLLVLAIAAGLISGSLLIVALSLLAELAMLGFVPRTSAFRRHVDELIENAERAEAAKARAALLLQMDEMHREELERLEALVDRIRENVRKSGASTDVFVDDCLGLSRLTKSFVCLAIAHRASKEALASTNRQALQDRIHSLEAMQSSGIVSERMRRLAQKRLAIAQKRAERWDETQEEIEAISHQLATISELIHLVYERSINPVDPGNMGSEIDRFMDDLEDSEGTLRELTELRVAEDVDPRILEKGRVRLAYAGARR